MRTVLCFGDSNTHGTRAMRFPGDRRRWSRDRRWCEVMARSLDPDWEVIAEGHPGRTAVFADPIEGAHKNGQLALPVLLESHRPLDLVIVMLGTNDLKSRFGVSAVDVALGIERLVIDIMRSDAGLEGKAPEILLAAPAAVEEVGIFADVFAGARAKSETLPDVLAEVAARNSVMFWDAGSVSRVDPVDGIHLDADAHAAIGTALAEKIRAEF